MQKIRKLLIPINDHNYLGIVIEDRSELFKVYDSVCLKNNEKILNSLAGLSNFDNLQDRFFKDGQYFPVYSISRFDEFMAILPYIHKLYPIYTETLWQYWNECNKIGALIL